MIMVSGARERPFLSNQAQYIQKSLQVVLSKLWDASVVRQVASVTRWSVVARKVF